VQLGFKFYHISSSIHMLASCDYAKSKVVGTVNVGDKKVIYFLYDQTNLLFLYVLLITKAAFAFLELGDLENSFSSLLRS